MLHGGKQTTGGMLSCTCYGGLQLLFTAHAPVLQISDAQQYMFHSGHAPLREWALDLVKECHSPPAPVQVAITSGAVSHLLPSVVHVDVLH
jgi:hypothetical protein